MNKADQIIAGIIDNCKPAYILSCAPKQTHVLQDWQKQQPECVIEYISDALNAQINKRYDLALLTNTLEHIPKEQGTILIGMLRNYGTHQIAITIPTDSEWHDSDFLSLGFHRLDTFTEHNGNYVLYTYNIDSYNHQRSWNNSRFWANPDMWHKARW